jgi:hypothetical protein
MLSGAAALLLERQPELTQPELRGLLIAGSATFAIEPDVPSRAGAGLLDVAGSVDAATAPLRQPSERPSAEQSRLRAAAASVVADATRSLSALLWLKDPSGAVFDASVERVHVVVTGGELRSEAARIAPGLYEFAVAAPPPALPTLSIDVSVDAEPLLSLELPVDGGRAPSPAAGDDGGCQFTPFAAQPSSSWPARSGALLMLALAALGRALAPRRRTPRRQRVDPYRVCIGPPKSSSQMRSRPTSIAGTPRAPSGPEP